METQKVGCHLGSGKSHHFTSVPLVQRNPMMITHTHTKKKEMGCMCLKMEDDTPKTTI